MKKISIVGIGMGAAETWTMKAYKTIQNAEVILGAKRMVEAAMNTRDAKALPETFLSYQPEEIQAFIQQHTASQYCIVVSGDTGFYSATKSLKEVLRDYEVTVIPGISSVSYFFSKIGLGWEDAVLASAHGRDVDIVRLVNENEKVFLLTGNNVSDILRQLIGAGLAYASVYVGEHLSYETERIVTGSVKELADQTFASVSVMVILNDKAKQPLQIGISDEKFLRGKVPMTKSEVRAVILSKLQLQEDAICYDIGAGTGSVSIEMALNCRKGTVYGIEEKKDAIDLILQNKEKFHCNNLQIVEGFAPDVLEDLPAPSHVFIGGSKGRLEEILHYIFGNCMTEHRSSVRVVMSAITLETMGEMVKLCQNYPMHDLEFTQIGVAKAKQIGAYHMMEGQNPILIVSGTMEFHS